MLECFVHGSIDLSLVRCWSMWLCYWGEMTTCYKRGNFENGKKTSINAHCKLEMVKKKSSKYCRRCLSTMMTLYSISSTGIPKISSTDTILHNHTCAHANMHQEKEVSFLIPYCIQKFLAQKHDQQLQNSICRPWIQ